MRRFILLLLVCLQALDAQAATTTAIPEIRLSTGEILKQVTFLSQTPTHITVKVAGGMRQIDKRLLPPDLQRVYPIDEDAAARRLLAAAEAARAAEQRQANVTMKQVTPVETASGPADEKPPTARLNKDTAQISFSPDPEGSGPMVTIYNLTRDKMLIPKGVIKARMVDDKVYPLKIACKGDLKLELGGAITVLGNVLTIPPNGSLIFRGYFYGDYQVRKHTVVEVYFGK